MRLPFFGRGDDAEPLRIPRADTVETGYGVYVRTPTTPPAAEALRTIALAWIDDHAEEPLRSALRASIDRGLVTITVGEKDLVGLPEMRLLRWLGLGEAEQEQLRETTHVVVVRASEPNMPPRAGLWSALAASRAIGAALSGLVVDLLTYRRLHLPVEFYQDRLPGDGAILVPRHIAVLTSVGERGLGWMTTKGMRKFGIPEVQLEHVPPNLTGMLGHLVNGICHVLGTAAITRTADHNAPRRELEIGPEIRIGAEDVARAAGEDPWPLREGVQGWTTVRLEYTGRRRQGMEPFISIVPPRSFRGDPGVWLYRVLADVMGEEGTVLEVKSGSTAMLEAHRRAVTELPAAKRRFQDGLPPGTTLFVKHGFAVAGGANEYMWVAVNTWVGDRIQGQLANDPAARRDLRAGQIVRLREDEVFDWLMARPDGATEGGYTNIVVQDEGRTAG